MGEIGCETLRLGAWSLFLHSRGTPDRPPGHRVPSLLPGWCGKTSNKGPHSGPPPGSPPSSEQPERSDCPSPTPQLKTLPGLPNLLWMKFRLHMRLPRGLLVWLTLPAPPSPAPAPSASLPPQTHPVTCCESVCLLPGSPWSSRPSQASWAPAGPKAVGGLSSLTPPPPTCPSPVPVPCLSGLSVKCAWRVTATCSLAQIPRLDFPHQTPVPRASTEEVSNAN